MEVEIVRAVPVTEFTDKISEFVSAVEHGEEIMVTRDGQPAVRLLPAESREERFERQRRALERSVETREWLRAQGVRVTREEIRGWIDEGRP